VTQLFYNGDTTVLEWFTFTTQLFKVLHGPLFI